jgi:zinc transport system substrate-binding protein
MRTSLRLLAALATVATFGLGATACADESSNATNDGPVTVVASFYPLAEMAERVGGDRVEVTNLTPAGTEPHDLELSPDQVDELLDADVVLYLGGGFQPAVEEVVDDGDGVSVDLLASGDPSTGAEEATAEAGEVDPHFWLDPMLLADAVRTVEAALAEADPSSAELCAVNADRLVAELDELDAELEAGLASCERDQLVTSHDAFSYLTERYGLTQVPVAGLSPEVEPDPERLDELADLIEDEGITTVFYESLVAADVAETLARETGVETDVLNPLEGLTDDELEAGEDYASIMRTNLAAIEEALGCD